MLSASYVEVEGTRLHLVSGGSGPPVLFLHGFPEFWYAWRRQLKALEPTHRVMAVDLPGFNLSERVDEPRVGRIASLVAGLLRQVAPGERVSLVGHDLGGAIAWEVAARHPELVDRLVVVNAPPAAVLAREIRRDPAQQWASAYMQSFRAPYTEVGLVARGCERLATMVFGAARSPDAFSIDDRKAYVQWWSRPGALTGPLGYYRAWDGDPTPPRPVRAPTLVLWGDADQQFLPGCLEGLDAYARDLVIDRIEGATHWVVHERPERVNDALRRFLAPPVRLEAPVVDMLGEREAWRRHPDYRCFVSSPDNARGLQVTPTIEPGRVWTRMTFEPDFSGNPGIAHGGVVFALLEGLMGWLVTSHAGRASLTTRATVAYHAPVLVGGTYEFEAVPDPEQPNTAKRVHAMARAYPVDRPDQVCAVARAQFHLPDRAQAERLLGREVDLGRSLLA